MNTDGFIYAATLTNQLAEEVSEKHWDHKLIAELGTLRMLFLHMVRVRDIYCDALHTGVVNFPGEFVASDSDIITELRRSSTNLTRMFSETKIVKVKIGAENLTVEELLHTAIHHEGIHQGQYYVAFKQAGIDLPRQWQVDWNM